MGALGPSMTKGAVPSQWSLTFEVRKSQADELLDRITELVAMEPDL